VVTRFGSIKPALLTLMQKITPILVVIEENKLAKL
jgi:hypothetical protein